MTTVTVRLSADGKTVQVVDADGCVESVPIRRSRLTTKEAGCCGVATWPSFAVGLAVQVALQRLGGSERMKDSDAKNVSEALYGIASQIEMGAEPPGSADFLYGIAFSTRRIADFVHPGSRIPVSNEVPKATGLGEEKGGE